MKHEKVVSIESRLERWNTAYENGDLQISVSNHGRIIIHLDGKNTTLAFFDSVDLLARVSEALEGTPGLSS
jgi:hypothetical protein